MKVTIVCEGLRHGEGELAVFDQRNGVLGWFQLQGRKCEGGGIEDGWFSFQVINRGLVEDLHGMNLQIGLESHSPLLREHIPKLSLKSEHIITEHLIAAC